ncbi:MAG: archease [Acidobacteria bacterium]|nr:archease [Acidobacteriota bacterium]
MIHPPYEVLEHTADVGLRVYGRTLPELFANAGLGLMALAIELQDFQEKERLSLSVIGSDAEQLLVNWLSEILYYVDAEGWAFTRFAITECSTIAITAEGWGEHRNPVERTRAVAVKAVTYHQLSVRETPDGFEATVYFDI